MIIGGRWAHEKCAERAMGKSGGPSPSASGAKGADASAKAIELHGLGVPFWKKAKPDPWKAAALNAKPFSQAPLKATPKPKPKPASSGSKSGLGGKVPAAKLASLSTPFWKVAKPDPWKAVAAAAAGSPQPVAITPKPTAKPKSVSSGSKKGASVVRRRAPSKPRSRSRSVTSIGSQGSDASVNQQAPIAGKSSRVRRRPDVDLTDSAATRPAKTRKPNASAESSGESMKERINVLPPLKVEPDAPGHIGRPERDTAKYKRLPGHALDLDQFPESNQNVIRNIVWHGVLPTNGELDPTGFQAGIDEEWKSIQSEHNMGGDVTNEIAVLARKAGSDVVMLSGYDTSNITNHREPNIFYGRGREKMLQDLKAARKIVFCENVGTEDGQKGKGWHWRVLVYDKGTHKLSNWDPLRKEGDRRDHGGKVAGYLRDFIRRHDLGEVDDDTPNQQNIPRQPDGSSCGAYCALYMLANAVKKPLPHKVTSFDAREFTGNAVLRGLQMKTVAAKKAFLRELKFT